MKPGQTVTLRISDVSRGGAGVAKTEGGRTVFVPFTVNGDVVRVKILELKKRYANAALLEVLDPSSERTTAKCQVFGKCGGCQWQHIPYTKQWQIKLDGIQQILRSSGITTTEPIDEFPAQNIWNYRNRIQLRGNKQVLGYFAPRSHDIVDIRKCEIAHPQINTELANIKAEGRHFKNIYKVEIEIQEDGNVRSTWNSRHAASGFRQVNDEQNHHLKTWIKEHLLAMQPVFDLFGGSANLSWDLAVQGRPVHCIDQSVPLEPPKNCPPNLQFHESDVLPWLKQRITDIKFKRIAHCDVPCTAIIDPPRGGLGDTFDDIVERLVSLNVNEIVAVGCKSDTWARDLAQFVQRGWKINKVAAFDFFPHTIHLECAAILNRKE